MRKPPLLLFFILFGTMFLFGFVENFKSISYPLIKTDFDITYNQQGAMVSFMSFGYMLFCLIGGILLGSFGLKKALITGYMLMFVGLLGMFFMPNFLPLVASLFLVFASFGIYSVSLNAMATRLFSVKVALLMSLLHFFYGVGSSISSRAAGFIASVLGWRQAYLISIPLVLALFIPSLFTSFPQINDNDTKKKGILNAFKTPMVWLFSAVLGLSIVVEICSPNWAGLYFLDVYKLDPRTTGAAFISNYFILFTISRLLSGFVIEKTGYLRCLFISGLAAVLIFFMGFLFGANGMYILPGLGLFTAIFWPTTMAIAMGYFRQDAPIMTSAIIIISGALNSSIQFLIGVINRLAGPAWGYRSCLLYALFLVVFIVMLTRRIRNGSPYIPVTARQTYEPSTGSEQ